MGGNDSALYASHLEKAWLANKISDVYFQRGILLVRMCVCVLFFFTP